MDVVPDRGISGYPARILESETGLSLVLSPQLNPVDFSWASGRTNKAIRSSRLGLNRATAPLLLRWQKTDDRTMSAVHRCRSPCV